MQYMLRSRSRLPWADEKCKELEDWHEGERGTGMLFKMSGRYILDAL